ncbi:condensin subunit BRN1 [Lachancea thermotolerans CBS 6340]|uniref:Condensin complex subunit 2 n=1 Tax=Lachancea thermotolerans (strain ATCC 56472 / CBS 6340 / NRRL Y-8284) TaxID=559295 RepID=C5DE26_LACTC|nr:KLTH0C05764p [Lachancea thermotolerans CBS 6340]CAR22037.1 KLTH0C05764p [Lachancea thermotolerans CBS 6340]
MALNVLYQAVLVRGFGNTPSSIRTIMADTIVADDDDRGLFTNKSTMMANFEQWIKMATDNKINSRNSWNFALIDYFHDLNVLKDAEDNINFQKASATLDGCVKIYSSRVDSVANETGILLSGLAQRKNQQQQGDDESGAEGAKTIENVVEGGVTIDPSTGLPISNEVDTTSRKRNYNRVLETTLVDFETLRMRELDQELSIDPLFKKALADFDEGGAKSLLLNTLHIDSSARVVFDATASHSQRNSGKPDLVEQHETSNISGEMDEDSVVSDSSHEEAEGSVLGGSGPVEQASNSHDSNMSTNHGSDHETIDVEDEILALGMDFIDFKLINEAEICPSMKSLKDVVEDINKAKSFIDDVNSKFDNFLTEKDLQSAIPDPQEDEGASYDLHDDGSLGADAGLYEDAGAMEDDQIDDPVGDHSGATDGDRSTVDPITAVMDRDVMAYFDETMKKSWRGREHWKVRNFKDRFLPKTNDNATNDTHGDAQGSEKGRDTNKPKKPPKQKFTLDFFNFNNIEEQIFDNKRKANIEMPQKLRTNPTRYLLPDDYQFSTQKVTRLFIKPQQHMSFFSHRKSKADNQRPGGILKFDEIDAHEDSQVAELADQNFWAQNYQMREQEKNVMEEEIDRPDMTAGLQNPFDDGEVDFNQAFGSEALDEFDSGSIDPPPGGSAGLTQPFGMPEGKVTYSRVSKKVDVKRLKDNIWKSISTTLQAQQKENSEQQVNEEDAAGRSTLKFTDIAENISTMYNGERKKDLSTSFCFICLLHLANEHGFEINPTEDFTDLAVEFQAEKDNT